MIYLDKDSHEPLYKQLYSNLKHDITVGKLTRDAPLKSLRVLEKELDISRNTVDRAYQQLIAEGYVRAVQGMGYFVEDIKSVYFEEIDIPAIDADERVHHAFKSKVRYDFEFETIESVLVPWSKWKKCVKDALLEESEDASVSYETSKGSLRLREALAGFLYRHRGVNCQPDQIILCPGTQFALEIITSILQPNTHRFAFEEPGYAAMRHHIESKGYSVTSIPVLENGLYTELLLRSNCNLLYVTPSHQFPTGAVTSISTRNELLKWAYSTDAYIIENDYDSEFRYGMLPIPSLQSLDHYQKVIYMGTLSKVLSPSIRCAYLVLPWKLVQAYEHEYKYFNSMLPTYHQVALAMFIEDGVLERHLRKLTIINEQKYNVLVQAIHEFMPDDVRIMREPAGVHTLVKILDCRDQKALIAELEKASIRIYSIKEHCHDQIHAYEDIFLMGFNSMSNHDIRSGCRAMADVLKRYLHPQR
ncbi:MAG: PLP-dependent aminotransferase family protein [Coriobacteriales bacterium]|jgi:GntR family transcriptional regulator/MocR family aminotransferase|nr:PLP-dependent aminotransferase family protein [Coriobacteriales bacterium]